MKKKIILLITFLLFSQILSAQLLDTISFSLNDYTFESVETYTRILGSESTYTEMVGYPELPRIEIRYVIPFGKEVSQLIVTDSTVQTLPNRYLLYPRQPDIPLSDPVPSGFAFDTLAYRSGTPFPGKTVELVEQFYELGYHVALLHVYPFSYIATQQTLRFCSSVSISLQYSDCASLPVRPEMESRRMFEASRNMVASMVRNTRAIDSMGGGPSRIIEMNESVPETHRLLHEASEKIPEYLIITNNHDIDGQEIEPYQGQRMTDIFQTLADWKTKKGVPTVVVTVDDICANYTGNDIQAKIHNFLADVYQKYGTMYVLLGGDTNVVPERMMDTMVVINLWDDNIERFIFASDLYYSGVDSDWDYNLNGIYGETEAKGHYNWRDVDKSDQTPNFTLARIPASSCSKAVAFVSKSTEYEKMTGIEQSERKYVNNITSLIAFLKKVNNPENASLNGFMNSIKSMFGDKVPVVSFGINQNGIKKWWGFETKKSLDSSILPFWRATSKSLATALFDSEIPNSNGEKAHIIIHADHSSYNRLGTASKNRNESLDRVDVDLFSNAPYHKILLTYGCSPGDFTQDCIVEHLLNNPYGGIVCAVASSTTSISYESNRIESFLLPLYEYKMKNAGVFLPEEYRMGYLHSKSWGSNLFDKRKNHLFGDPELPVWTREPLDLTVSVSPQTVTNLDTVVTVSVSGMAYARHATNDVMVCLMKDGEVYERAYYADTLQSHNFVFHVNPETAGSLEVTVTGHNYIPFETTVPVAITGRHAHVTDVKVQDGLGNNNGKADAGETVSLRIPIANNGTVPLTGVTATLSCVFWDGELNSHIGDYLTSSTSTVSYGSIGVNDTVAGEGFTLAFANAVPDRSGLRCVLTVSDGQGVLAVKRFPLAVSAPHLAPVSINHAQRAGSRDIGISIDVSNLGFGEAASAYGKLATSDVQMLADSVFYADLPHLSTSAGTFSCQNGASLEGAEFTLTLRDMLGNTSVHTFTLHTVTDTVENLSFTSGGSSIDLSWDPVPDSRGYLVYRSLTGDGAYTRLNDWPVPSSAFTDRGLGTLRTYHYAVTYLDASGNESPKARVRAWTTLPEEPGWPVALPDANGRPWGTGVNAADVDGDGKKEVFFATGVGDTGNGSGCDTIGVLYGFRFDGAELFDTDHNPTTVSGFASPGGSMNCTPAIGDIDNDGREEVVVATRCPDSGGEYKLCVYRSLDGDNDGRPDLAWETPIEFGSFNGAVLSDLDGDGTLEIIVANQGRHAQSQRTSVEVFSCDGSRYYPSGTIAADDLHNQDAKAVTMPAVADLDGDGSKEIVFGLESGVYLWSCKTETLTALVSGVGERTDCPVAVTDIDLDGVKEVLYMAVRDGRGYIRAANPDGTPVSGWGGDGHGLTLSQGVPHWEWPPRFCVADIDLDGVPEVLAADSDTLWMWSADGAAFGTGAVRIGGLSCPYMQPLAADIDGGGDCEVIVPSGNGTVHAVKTDGSPVTGWPLRVPENTSVPLVADLDGDGLNEVFAASATEAHLWRTAGSAGLNPWGRSRRDRYNNAVYELPCVHTATPVTVADTQVWNHDRLLDRDLVVENGGYLTIRSEVLCSPGTTVVVKQGGRLAIDGGRLAGSCEGEPWQGIEVWGNRQAHQFTVNGICAQGRLELRNGARVEDALCAVELWRPGYWGTTGGVVTATGASFINNRTAVRATHYENYLPANGKPAANLSSFRECQFSVTDRYNGPVFHNHVTLSHVRGVKFRACLFLAGYNPTTISHWDMGIHAVEAGFSVDGLCESPLEPCPSYKRSEFNGFFMAVKADSDGAKTPPAATVMHTLFYDNTYGVYLGKAEHASVLASEFRLGQPGHGDCATGVLSEETHHFCIEENDFNISGGAPGETYGVIITDSREQNDVYRNTFESLLCANLANGENTLGAGKEFLGLEYRCNDNIMNGVDFYTRGGDVQTNQGSYDNAAGNVFSDDGYHFYNGGDGVVNYFYNETQGHREEEPVTYNQGRFVPVPTSLSDGCPSNYGGPFVDVDTISIVLTPYQRLVAERVYDDTKESFDLLNDLYNVRLDGGDTPGLLSEVQNADAGDAPGLRASLLGTSPYLSREVLFATLDRHGLLGDTTLFEVLFSNPDELKRDTLMERVLTLEDPLPLYMVRVLERVAEGVSTRTALQTEMADARREYTRAASLIVRSILNDTVVDVADLRTWLGNMESIEADRCVVSSYVDEGDFTSAFSLAGTFPTVYGLTGNALVEHGYYMDMLDLYRTLYNSGRNTEQLDSGERADVSLIAAQSQGVAGAMARVVLANYLDADVVLSGFTCPGLTPPVGGRGGEYTPWSVEETARGAGIALEVAPNPAANWTAVRCTLPAGATEAIVEVSDLLGTRMAAYRISPDDGGRKILDLRGLPSGVYLVTLRCQGQRHTEKLVIAR